VTEPIFTAITAENTLLASDEQVVMQTVIAEVGDLHKSREQTIIRLLLDISNQRTYNIGI